MQHNETTLKGDEMVKTTRKQILKLVNEYGGQTAYFYSKSGDGHNITEVYSHLGNLKRQGYISSSMSFEMSKMGKNLFAYHITKKGLMRLGLKQTNTRRVPLFRKSFLGGLFALLTGKTIYSTK